MSQLRNAIVAFLGVIVTFSLSAADSHSDELRSGLEVGSTPLPFNVKDCTGPAAGKTLCYFCRYGKRPVVAIFTRELNENVANLIKHTDDAVERHRDSRLAAFVVLLQKDTTQIENRLKHIATTKELLRTPLTILKESQQQLQLKYGISPNAAVTVITWRNLEVKSSAGFDSAGLSADEISRVGRSIDNLANR